MLDQIPGWVPLVQVGVQGAAAFAAALLVASVAQLAVLRSIRGLGDDAHWSERARRRLPARKTMAFASFFLLLTLGALPALDAAVAPLVPAPAMAVAGVAGAWLGARLGMAQARRRLGVPEPGLKARASAFVVGLLVLYPLAAVAVAFAVAAPAGLTPAGVAWAASFALVTWLIVEGHALRLAAAAGLLRPAPPELSARVDAMGARLGLPPVRTYVVRMNQYNAFAMPHLKLVLVTDSLLRQLSAPEIAAILAHELGHIGEAAGVVRKRKLLMWSVFLIVAGAYLMRGLGVPPVGQIAVLMVVLALKGRWAGGFSRAAEERADQIACELEEEPGLFARALERLYGLNQVPAVLAGKGQSHPHLYDRMVAAGVQPDFPRPAPPDPKAGSRALGVIVALTLVLGVGVQLGLSHAAEAPAEASRGRVLAAIAVGGADARSLGMLAAHELAAGRAADAAELLEGAAGVSRRHAGYYWLRAAEAHARAGRCGRAVEVMEKGGGAGGGGGGGEGLARVAVAVADCWETGVAH